jgi:hypothetical protein
MTKLAYTIISHSEGLRESHERRYDTVERIEVDATDTDSVYLYRSWDGKGFSFSFGDAVIKVTASVLPKIVAKIEASLEKEDEDDDGT